MHTPERLKQQIQMLLHIEQTNSNRMEMELCKAIILLPKKVLYAEFSLN
jgi:hypothetical protein